MVEEQTKQVAGGKHRELVSCLANSSALKKEAILSSEMAVDIPDYTALQPRRSYSLYSPWQELQVYQNADSVSLCVLCAVKMEAEYPGG
jgi:ArsR family metal-binding transcriptional regulator